MTLSDRVFVGRIKVKTTDKKNKKAQPELLRVLDQPMVSKIKEEEDARKAHEEYLLKIAKEKEDGRIANEEQTKR
jgi:hypothetical protein